MLLDDEQAAINELVATCRESMDHYQDALERTDDAALETLFRRIHATRHETVESLSRIVRESGELPRAAHADKEHLDQFVTHVKALLSEDSRIVFLDARIDGERRLQGLVRDALELELADEARACVERLRAEADEALARLEEAR